MAYSPVALIAPNYDELSGYWLKFYKPTTDTPIAMATDSTGGTTLAKAELNINGFINTVGNTLFIPYLDQSYDAFLFATEAQADANDTGSALRIAQNANPFGLAFEQEVIYFDFIGETGVSLTVPDMPKGILLIVDGDVQEQGVSGDVKDFLYNSQTGIITLTTALTGNERVFVTYGAIVAVTATKPAGVLSFQSVNQMVIDVNLEVGDKVSTYFFNAIIHSDWQVVPAGTGAGDMTDGTINLSGSGFQAQLIITKSMSPLSFGAVGGGLVDDSLEIQNCINTCPFTLIDQPYGIKVLEFNNYVDCVGNGKFIYLGTIEFPLTKSIVLKASNFGSIVYDANEQELQCIVASDGLIHTGKSITVKDLKTEELASNTPIAILVTNGTTLDVDRIYGENFTQGNPTAFDNGSVPQLMVASGVGSRIECNDGKGLGIRAGLLVDNDATLICNDYVHELSFDQAIYNLGGTTRVGNLYQLNSNEEVIVNLGTVYVDNLMIEGSCFPFLRIQGADYTYIGKVHATAPPGTAEADKEANLCKGILGHRQGNIGVDSGEIWIGEITGQFARTIARTGQGSGTSKSITIQNADFDWYIDATKSDFSFNDFMTFSGCKRINIENMNIRMLDPNDTVTVANATRFDDLFYDATSSILEFDSYAKVEIIIYDGSGNIHPFLTYQGQQPSDLMNFIDGRWQTNVGPYRRETNIAPVNTTINNTAPLDGFWKKGYRLTNTSWNGTGINEDTFICTASGTPGTWTTRIET